MIRRHPSQRRPIKARYILIGTGLILFFADRVAAGVLQCGVLGCLPSW